MCLQATKTAANQTAVSQEINKIAQSQKNQQRTAISSKLASHDNIPQAQMQSFDLIQSHILKSHESKNLDSFGKRTTGSSEFVNCNVLQSVSFQQHFVPSFGMFPPYFSLVRNIFSVAPNLL